MLYMKNIRTIIREMVEKEFNLEGVGLEEAQLDEERITNKEASEKVNNRENFVASHTYGEDLGGLGEMYVAYSYGEQHPLYLWYKDRWYYNNQDYIKDDGEINIWTRKHLRDLKPNSEVQARPTAFLNKLIRKFKKKHGLGDNTHTDLVPGEK
jgi:hypothetical protein